MEGVEGVTGVTSSAGGVLGRDLCKAALALSFRDEMLGTACPRVERRVDTVARDEGVCLV